MSLFIVCRVEFEDVHRLANGHVEHSPEFFYAGSLWKVSQTHYSVVKLSLEAVLAF